MKSDSPARFTVLTARCVLTARFTVAPARSVLIGVVLMLVAAMASCSSYDPENMTTGGNYPPVKRKDLIGTTCSIQSGLNDAPLSWMFMDDGFEIRATEGSLPADIVGDILGPQAEATTISGKWTLHGEDLTLTNILHDGMETEIDRAVLHCFFTGVIRIQTTGPDGRQYVFSKAR